MTAAFGCSLIDALLDSTALRCSSLLPGQDGPARQQGNGRRSGLLRSIVLTASGEDITRSSDVHSGERDPVRHAQLGEHVPASGVLACQASGAAAGPRHRWSVPGHQQRYRPLDRGEAQRAACLAVYTGFKLASGGLARVLARCRIAHTATPFAEAHCAEEMFCAPRVAACLSSSRYSYSAICAPRPLRAKCAVIGYERKSVTETCQVGLLVAAAGHTEHQAPWCDDDGLVAVSGGRCSRSM